MGVAGSFVGDQRAICSPTADTSTDPTPRKFKRGGETHTQKPRAPALCTAVMTSQIGDRSQRVRQVCGSMSVWRDGWKRLRSWGSAARGRYTPAGPNPPVVETAEVVGIGGTRGIHDEYPFCGRWKRLRSWGSAALRQRNSLARMVEHPNSLATVKRWVPSTNSHLRNNRTTRIGGSSMPSAYAARTRMRRESGSIIDPW